MRRRAVVTGAFSYIGSAVTRALLDRGWTVHTLTNRTRPAGAEAVTAAPLRFEREHLVREFRGADALVNTFWIRLPHDGRDFETAVADSRRLVEAAAAARVGRVVHVSVSNATLTSDLGYYRGKAKVEEVVRSAGCPYAIVRPTLVVGPSDVLTSNIAWFLRRFPVFPVPGGGHYRLQPVTLEDTGRIIADAVEAEEDLEIDAAGPDTMTFRAY
ncbi:MAG: SDR family oxidoreductase, partial [Planctomycetota bacterium]